MFTYCPEAILVHATKVLNCLELVLILGWAYTRREICQGVDGFHSVASVKFAF